MQNREEFVVIVARNPSTVACEEALLVCALRSVGIRPSRRFPLQKTVEEIDGTPVTLWTWLLEKQSADGLYDAGDLIKKWQDAAWQASNPNHEWAILRRTLNNFAVVAADLRRTPLYTVVRKGANAAYIPASASPARRDHLLGKLEGRVPLNSVFVEPPNPELEPA